MLFQRWVGLTFRVGSFCLLPRGSAGPPLFEIEKATHVCFCGSRSRNSSSYGTAVMAEEAKKLAAYAAVDNHIQVPLMFISVNWLIDATRQIHIETFPSFVTFDLIS